nr:transposase (putative), gypsy type [Tanacetum cinerariifolium]
MPTVGYSDAFMQILKRVDVCHLVSVPIMLSYVISNPLIPLKIGTIISSGVDDFVFLAFLWHTTKHVTRDPDPAAADFNAQDYATLVAHPSPFQKFSKAFLCLVGLSRHYTLDEETYPSFYTRTERVEIDIFAFIHTSDPTKVRVVKQERNEDEPGLLDTTIGRTVPLLLVAPDRADNELEASVERLFDKGGSGTQTEQGDSRRGGLDANIQPVVEAVNTIVEDAAPVQSRCQGKRKFVVVDAGGVSHPPKNLKEDHGTLSGASICGMSRSTLQRLLAEAMLNAEVRVAAIPTLPFVTTSISSTPERKDGDHTDSVAEPNLRTIRASQRFVISSDSSHHSGTKVAEVEVDSLISDFLVGSIRTVINPDIDLQNVFVPQWSVTNGSRLDDGRVFHQMVDEFSPPNAEARMHAEYNVKEKKRLESFVENQGELLKAREEEIESLNARLLLKEAEAAKAIRLRAKASNFETVDKSIRDETNALRERNVILEKERNALDVKVTELETSVVSKERELTDLNALVTSVKSQNDKLAEQIHELEISSCGLKEKVTVYENCMEQLEKFQDDRMKVVNDKFDKLYTDFVDMALHLEEKFYPHLLTTIFGRRWLLTQGMELAIIKCLNSLEYLSSLEATIGKAIVKADYISTLQQLQNVNFPLLTKLRSNKDASIEDLMNILRLERPLVDKLGLDELQPNVDQLMKIKENIANQRSVRHDVFVPLSEPLSAAVLIGTTVINMEDQAATNGNAASFPNVDDAELNIIS